MNINISHSNTPAFGVNKSATSQILHREPTKAEMAPSRLKKSISVFQDISLIAIISTILIFLILKSCGDQVNNQNAVAVKQQFSLNSK